LDWFGGKRGNLATFVPCKHTLFTEIRIPVLCNPYMYITIGPRKGQFIDSVIHNEFGDCGSHIGAIERGKPT